MKLVEFHPEARSELLESARYYESQQPQLGRRFLAAVRDSTQRIQAQPQLYRVVDEDPGGDLRQCRVLRFPFGLIYRPREASIEIIAVMHLQREPGYWRARVETSPER